MKKIRLRCEKCKSTDLEFCAYGVWNEDRQEYDWEISKGEVYCNKCNDLTPVEETIIEEIIYGNKS